MVGNLLDGLVTGAEREHLCAEDAVVHGESPILYGSNDIFACAGD
jgi:hypothetical protein